MKTTLLIWSVLHLFVATLAPVYAQSKLYWADTTTIWRGNLDGTNVEVIQTNIDSLTALSVYPSDRKLYWSTQSQVWRASLTGANPELIFQGTQITDISIDTQTKRLYITPPLICLDLTGIPIDTLSLKTFVRFSLDPANQKLYGILEATIQSASIDTSGNLIGLRPLFSTGFFDDLIFLPTTQKIYWIDIENAAIRRGGLQTNQAQTLLQNGLVNVHGLVVNENDEKIYWTTKSRPSSTVSTVYSANPDGSNIKEMTSVSSLGGWVQDMIIYHPSSGNAAFGDVNADGKIDSVDVILILRGLIGLETLTPEQQSRADVNGDKSIDSRDATLILRRIINLINQFPVENQ